MVGINETLGTSSITLQKLRINGIDTTKDIAGVTDEILAMSDIVKAKESFMLIKQHLGEEELSAFAKRGEFAFIMEVTKSLDDLQAIGVIEAVWAYNDNGNLKPGYEEKFAKASCQAVFGMPDSYASVNIQDASTLFKSVNATQAIVSEMIAAKTAAAITIPEKRTATLGELVKQFIKQIMEVMLGKPEVKQQEVPAVETEKDHISKLSKETGDFIGRQ